MWRCLTLLVLATAAGRADAQRLGPEITRFETIQPEPGRDRAGKAPDYRYEGLAIGAGIGVVLGVLGGFAICDHSDVSCGSFVPLMALGMGGAVGFTGLMIGGLFDKPQNGEEPARPDSLES